MSENKLSVLVYGAIIATGLAVAGAAAFFSLKTPSECATEVLPLPDPATLDLVVNAVGQLIELGVVPSGEAVAEALVRAQYVLDPDEEWELEYWLIFDGVAAEFNFSCPLNEENFPLNIEYEGTRGL